MFAVVGCRDCGAFWIVRDTPKTTGCPRCGTRHEYSRLKKFIETDDADHARAVRSQLLAEQSGYADPSADLGSFSEQERRYSDSQPTDFVDAQSLDSPPRAHRPHHTTSADENQSALDSARPIVLGAIRDLDTPTQSSILRYARAHNVPREQARAQLDTLVETGVVSVDNDQYSIS